MERKIDCSTPVDPSYLYLVLAGLNEFGFTNVECRGGLNISTGQHKRDDCSMIHVSDVQHQATTLPNDIPDHQCSHNSE